MENVTNDSSKPIKAYQLTREHSGVWMYCGETIQGVLECLKVELESDLMDGNERECITIEPVMITQAEIDAMPDFPGW